MNDMQGYLFYYGETSEVIDRDMSYFSAKAQYHEERFTK
jgi:hypothetical protein